MSLKVSNMLAHKFSEKHGVRKLGPVSMVTVNNWFQVVKTSKQWYTYYTRSIKISASFVSTKMKVPAYWEPFAQRKLFLMLSAKSSLTVDGLPWCCLAVIWRLQQGHDASLHQRVPTWPWNAKGWRRVKGQLNMTSSYSRIARVTSSRAWRRRRHNCHFLKVATVVLSMPNFEFFESDHY